MKKFLVVLVVVVLTCMSSMAFAADIAVSGSIEIRGRNYVNLDLNDQAGTMAVPNNTDNKNDTQERVRLTIDAKAGDALSGRIGIENDYDTWGRFESPMANGKGGSATGAFLMLREAWLGFRVPGTPIGIKGGHMLLQLGNGWFFRDMKYGSDAWVVYTDIDALHLGVVNIKVSEGSTARADDTDAFAFVATYKLSDTMTAGINFTNLNDRSGKSMNTFYGTTAFSNAVLQNMEAHFAGTVGPAKLKVEVDVQSGDATTQTVFATPVKHKFKGNQVVLEANIALDPVTVNATIARGSGATANTASPDMKEYIALMDADMHYTLIYEYLVPTAAQQSFATLHTGFGNTTAVSLGAGVNATKNLSIGADVWYLKATKKVATYTDALGNDVLSDDLGLELDAKINWKLYENLSWNNTIGYFMPGDAYKISAIQDADNARAIMSVLSFKF